MRKRTRLVAVIAFVVALMLPASSAKALGCTGCEYYVTPYTQYWRCADTGFGWKICIVFQGSCVEDCPCPGSYC